MPRAPANVLPRRHFLGGVSSFPLAVALASAACLDRCKKSDAELAEEERKKAEEQWRESKAVAPWRVFKGSVRSHQTNPRPEVYTRFDAAIAGLSGDQKPEALIEYFTWLALNRDQLDLHDEDKFPLLLPMLLGPTPLPPWYDAGAEHLLWAGVLVLVDLADKGNSLPIGELLFYELSRATPSDAWPPPLRTAATLARGAAYFVNELHYASDEELTRYIEAIGGLKKEELAIVAAIFAEPLKDSKLPPEEGARRLLLATGYFLRAANRGKLKRDEAAAADLEAALDALEEIGIENEITLFAWSALHLQRGHHDKAAASMRKLAESPHIDDATKKEMIGLAGRFEKEKEDPGLFSKQTMLLAVVAAVIRRAGGVEKVIGYLVGPETAQKLMAPFRVFDEAWGKLGEVKDLASLDKLKGGAKSGFDALKAKASALTEEVK